MSADVESPEEIEQPGPRFRHDVSPEGVAPKRKRGRPPKARHDSEVSGPSDGWGDPLTIKMAPGWVGCFVTAEDLSRFANRPWTPGTWGDPRIKQYLGTKPGKKGEPIVYKELSLYVMSAADQVAIAARDPRRRDHNELGKALFKYAADTGGRVSRTESIFQR